MRDGGKISILSFVRNTGPERNNAARGPIQCRFRRIASGRLAAVPTSWIVSTGEHPTNISFDSFIGARRASWKYRLLSSAELLPRTNAFFPLQLFPSVFPSTGYPEKRSIRGELFRDNSREREIIAKYLSMLLLESITSFNRIGTVRLKVSLTS